MKTHVKLTIVSVILVIVACLVIWKDEIFKHRTIYRDSYNYTVLIINKRTGDTIMNRKLKSLSPMELDSLTLYLNKR